SNTIFAIPQSATECYHLEQAYTSSVTVGQMYNYVKGLGVVSDKDKKWSALSLRLMLNELDPFEDEPDEEFMNSSKKSFMTSAKASASTRKSKRKLESASTHN
ncbi:hypothetical protein PAXINDRAFT_158844, partial [Paxillus involutus ATCC 200175]